MGSAANAAAVSVTIEAAALRVSALGSDLLAGELCGRLLVDECSWSFERDGEGAAVLQLDLMKREPTSDGRFWGYLLTAERDAARGH